MSSFQKIQHKSSKPIQTSTQQLLPQSQSQKSHSGNLPQYLTISTTTPTSSLLQLNLSNNIIPTFTAQINSYLASCKSLELLYLVDCNLHSIQYLNLPELLGIDLSINLICDQGSFFQSLLNCKKLQQIIVVKNKIQKLETILILSQLQNLYELDISGNPVISNNRGNKGQKSISQQHNSSTTLPSIITSGATTNPITILFQKLPNIQYINGKNINGQYIPLQNDQSYDELSDSFEEDFQVDEEEENQNCGGDGSEQHGYFGGAGYQQQQQQSVGSQGSINNVGFNGSLNLDGGNSNAYIGSNPNSGVNINSNIFNPNIIISPTISYKEQSQAGNNSHSQSNNGCNKGNNTNNDLKKNNKKK